MSKTILCVDDSVTMQKVAAITFAATEYECVAARNVDEGIAAAKSHKPVLVLADAVMPGKTGYDLCEAIKSDPELAAVPVLVMCGNSQAYDPARGSAAGADGHVTKPWDTQVMLDKIAEVLGGSSDTVLTRPAPEAPKPAPPPVVLTPTPSPAALNAAEVPEPPRSATIMGMPSLKLPPTKPSAGQPEFSAPQTPPAPTPKPTLRAPTPPKQPQTKPPGPPPRPSLPTPPPIATKPPPRAPAPAPVPAPRPAPPPEAIPAGMRPPMIPGTPTRRPDIGALQAAAARAPAPAPAPAPVPAVGVAPAPMPRPMPMPEAAPTPPPRAKAPEPPPGLDAALAGVDAATTSAAASVARDAGLDPNGPEMAALLKLSREVIERVVWEVVPELAETIIRENVDRLAK